MNLTEALNVALPDLPARSLRRAYPRLHPLIVAREHIEAGERVVHAIVSGANQMYRFTLEQWWLMQLFNGENSFEDVARLFREQTGIAFSPNDIREYASSLDEIWYASAEQPNLTLAQKEAEERNRRNKKWEDITMITVGHWDPDEYLNWVHSWAKFIYTRWFTVITLAFFAVMASIFVTRWSEIGADTWKYYDFTEKGLAEIAEFWLLFCFLGFFHESAHGLTCKHFGGAVHKMGFLLYYLEPCFFVDVTEVYVYAGKWERIATSIAGIWVELIFCSAASILWWGTPVGTPLHDFAYKIILITGVGVVLINLNPLIKLDGYYILSELLGIIALKEDSTAFVSSWVKKNVFRLPVEVEFVPRRRRWAFTLYALASGLYSYTLLYLVVGFAYNVFRKYSPDWAILPALLVAWLLFRSRIRTLVRFMKTTYLDKKQVLARWVMTPSGALAVAAILLLSFTPFWPETRSGRFILEPVHKASIHARVSGEITAIVPEEAQYIDAGTTLVCMRNPELEGLAAHAAAELRVASLRATKARLHYEDYARAEKERDSLAQQSAELQKQVAALEQSSPVSGVVTTPHVRDLLGSYVAAGQPLFDVADLSLLQARIYLPEFEMKGVQVGERVTLVLDSVVGRYSGGVAAIAPVSSDIEPGLLSMENYKGMTAQNFYAVTVEWPNPENHLRPGMAGTAKVILRRHSLAAFGWRAIHDFVRRTVW
ncbi:MAG TPA: efflux RND transporter periplasmic adaptor subunit [Candidatus Binatia bacterium]|nr:efflux RND transporter periplasmic adaptor subunit [Candidatus Binatia bacterium]